MATWLASYPTSAARHARTSVMRPARGFRNDRDSISPARRARRGEAGTAVAREDLAVSPCFEFPDGETHALVMVAFCSAPQEYSPRWSAFESERCLQTTLMVCRG